MDFFAAQDSARRSTALLIALFLLAIVGIVVITSILLMAVMGFLDFHSSSKNSISLFNWDIFLITALVVCLVVGLSSWYKMSRLAAGGGDGVAQMLGGEPVFHDDNDLHRKRLVNVVEEMAIAAGMPVPQAYVLPEDSINAFAAGYGTSDAVVAVTRGALYHLNREQLQGVIAHEFSHILNGDMRINIRLMGILYGILVLGILGRQFLRGTSRSSSRKGGGTIGIALALVFIGYIGTFCGNLIKAAVNRQREFLADAAAVQFTRNPDGIGGALLQIGAASRGSSLLHPKTEEISHLFFGQAISSLGSLFATHPPLAERIKRILPAWDGSFPSLKEEAAGPTGQFSGTYPGNTAHGLAGGSDSPNIGEPGNIDVPRGKQLLQEIPESIQKRARDPFASRAVIAFLLLDQDRQVRQRQLDILRHKAEAGVRVEAFRLIKEDLKLSRKLHLPILELVLPSLRRLSPNQCRQFLSTLQELIRADNQISLFEWCIISIVGEYLDGMNGKITERPRSSENYNTNTAASIAISALCYVSASETVSAEHLFTDASRQLGLKTSAILKAENLSLRQLSEALRQLRKLSPEKKRAFFSSCRHIALSDKTITTEEAEILRSFAATLDIPLPPS